MYKERLFERIKNIDKNPKRTRTITDAETEIKSILSYLNELLTVRHGSTIIADDFGISDITNYHEKAFGEFVDQMQVELRDTISKYEPRLKNVKVIYVGKDEGTMNFKFKLVAELRGSETDTVAFETTINPDGRVSIYE